MPATSAALRPRTLAVALLAACLCGTAITSSATASESAGPATGGAAVHRAPARASTTPTSPTQLLLANAPWMKTLSSITPREAAASPVPSRSTQIKVLSKALKRMQSVYAADPGFNPGPADVFDYDVGRLWSRGIDGAGTTIAVVEGWDYPAIGTTVAGFDKALGLPNPVIETDYLSGDGKLPAKCPAGMNALGSYGSCKAWGGELILDVISAHLMAPYAKILISVAPADSEITDDAASQVAPPEMMEAVGKISSEHLANVISISDGSGESSYRYGLAEIAGQDPGELAAATAGIPLLVATGDTGVLQELPVHNADKVTKTPDTGTWDDSPWVTAVGGSVPNLSPTGARVGPDPLWNVGRFAEGAGYSSIFARPSYQKGVSSITRSPMRSVPDLTMDARDGTSEAAPMLAGVLSLATQMNRGDVGPVNTALYDVLGPKGATDGISDVVAGNNTYTNGSVVVPGFFAARGFDVASGWGTIYAPRFVPSLVRATKAAKQDRAVRGEARTELSALRQAVTLSPSSLSTSGTSYLAGFGFLPNHPVQLLIDHHLIATLKAGVLGTVTYTIDPAALSLPTGPHAVELKSMLIDVSGTLTTT